MTNYYLINLSDIKVLWFTRVQILFQEQLNVMYHIIPFNVWYMRIENFFQYREMNGN